MGPIPQPPLRKRKLIARHSSGVCGRVTYDQSIGQKGECTIGRAADCINCKHTVLAAISLLTIYLLMLAVF
jgi:hypothetical protein